jgi:hypothetical protein
MRNVLRVLARYIRGSYLSLIINSSLARDIEVGG